MVIGGCVALAAACVPGGEDPTSTPATSTPDTTVAPTTPPTTEDGPIALRDDLAIVNSRPRDEPGNALQPWIDGIGYVRGWGGSRGMATYPTLEAVPELLLAGSPGRWDVAQQSEIDGLLRLQSDHGVQIIYLVNVNDTFESQSAFIERLREAGVDLAMLEMGNELYLPKFRNGDTTKLGVTRSWTAPEYVELLRAWVPDLRGRFAELPIYGIGASHGVEDDAPTNARRGWNQTMLAALDETPALLDGVTFHQYAGEGRTDTSGEEEISDGEFFGYLDTFGELPIAITESGYAVASATDEELDRAEQFWSGLRDALKPGDTFGVHLLFDPGGRTPVGDRFASWLAGWAGRP